MPFTGLNHPTGVAVDNAGAVYVTDAGNTGCSSCRRGRAPQSELPFTGLKDPHSVAVDTAGNVYITESIPNNRVLKLPAQ